MRTHLIRHGDPDYANDTLTPLGHQQAKCLADALDQTSIDALFASPMGRAQATALYTSKGKGMPVETLEWLHELNGNYEGQLWSWNMHGTETLSRPTALSVDEWHLEIVYGPHMQRVVAPFYNSFDAFLAGYGYEREGFRYRIRRTAPETLTLFCHAGVVLTLLAHVLHIPLPVSYSQFGCDPSSVTTIDMEEAGGHGVFRLTGLNDMSHCATLRHAVQQEGAFPG